jgi:hypothetical protein
VFFLLMLSFGQIIFYQFHDYRGVPPFIRKSREVRAGGAGSMSSMIAWRSPCGSSCSSGFSFPA